jgi:hypothetical protein
LVKYVGQIAKGQIMENSWQMWLALACVTAAAGQLGFRLWRQFAGHNSSSSCGGGCSSCPSVGKSEVPELIQLEMKP